MWTYYIQLVCCIPCDTQPLARHTRNLYTWTSCTCTRVLLIDGVSDVQSIHVLVNHSRSCWQITRVCLIFDSMSCSLGFSWKQLMHLLWPNTFYGWLLLSDVVYDQFYTCNTDNMWVMYQNRQQKITHTYILQSSACFCWWSVTTDTFRKLFCYKIFETIDFLHTESWMKTK